MQSARLRKWLLLCALALPLLLVVVAFLPSVRGIFIYDDTDEYGHARKGHAPTKAEPLRMLPFASDSFEGKQFVFGDTGYPSQGGRALYWLRSSDRKGPNDFLLVSLPDGHALCRATGFDKVFWLPGGKAVGATVTPRSLPAWPALERLWTWIGHYDVRYYEIDWKTGGSKAINISRLPKASRPTFSDGGRSGSMLLYAVSPAYLTDAYERAGRVAVPMPDQKTGVPVMHVYDRRTQTRKDTPLEGTDGTASMLLTFIADDEVLYIKNTASHQQALFRMTLSTGAETQVWPQPSIDSSATE